MPPAATPTARAQKPEQTRAGLPPAPVPPAAPPVPAALAVPGPPAPGTPPSRPVVQAPPAPGTPPPGATPPFPSVPLPAVTGQAVDVPSAPGTALPGLPVEGTGVVVPPVAMPPVPVPPVPVPPGRSRRADRRPWVSLAVAALALVAGLLAFLPHRDAWVGHNGDHYYYASTALQYAGVDYDDSLRFAAVYFDYPYSGTQLDLGYLNPAVAPLIYPRVVLGLLALPAVDRYGIEGIWFPGLLCGGLSLALLMVLAVRQIGRVGLVALPVLAGLTRYAPEFMFGIYQEAPVILATTLMLLTFPLGRTRRTWMHAVAAAGLVPVMMLSRQVPLLPLGMALGGWLWAWAGSRRFRNPWLPFALTVPPMTVLSYWLLSIWAPYSTLPFLYDKTGTSSVDALLAALPDMWSVSIGTDWQELLANDVPMIVVTGMGLAGFLLVLRNPMAGVFLGTLASGAATELLNGQPNSFRYLAPSLPVVLLMAALAVSWPVHQLPRLLGQHVRDWPGTALVQGQARRKAGVVHVLPDGRMRISRPPDPGPPPTRWGPSVAAGAAWLAVVVAVVGAVATHRPAPLDGAGAASEPVSAAAFTKEFDKPWPLTATEGTLVCAGSDYQIWFVTPDGVRYAVSGTAMARSFRTPRVLEVAPEFRYAWPEIKPLLTQGMRLCGSPRVYQSDPRS